MHQLLQALPTRQELDAQLKSKLDFQVLRLEQMFKAEIRPIQEAVEKLAQKTTILEEELVATQVHLGKVDASTSVIQSQMLRLALKVNDLENRGRRNNIRIRGLPESVGAEALKNTITSIFNHYLGRPQGEYIEIDRVHRLAGPRRQDSPRDVICRVHYYIVKEDIMRAAWDRGPFDYKGAKVILLQDLAKSTLDMRRVLKPLLSLITQKGGMYRWGFPFAVLIRLNGKTFSLKAHSELPAAFKFLDSPPLDIPDWSTIVLDS